MNNEKKNLYINDNYPEQRCIIGNANGFLYEKITVPQVYMNGKIVKFTRRVIQHFRWKLGFRDRMWDKTASVRIERVDGIVHLFNTICRGGRMVCFF